MEDWNPFSVVQPSKSREKYDKIDKPHLSHQSHFYKWEAFITTMPTEEMNFHDQGGFTKVLFYS